MAKARKKPAPAKNRAPLILERLAKVYPDWGCTLDFTTPFELLVATILAAQTTDENVNEVTKTLFRKYRGPRDYLAVSEEELQRDIFKTGFFRNKAKAVRAVSQQLLERWGGEVPRDIDALTELYGVGRKTASIVAGAAYGVPGIGVDTHVDRVANRLALTARKNEKDRERIEVDLRALYPPADWVKLTWCLILHGRRCCHAKKPECPRCPVLDLCPFPDKTEPAGK